MATAFIFPGQGSQSIGMGKDLCEAFREAREVLQEVDEALGQNLSKLMFCGPIEELTLTSNSQPAIMAVSIAVLRVLVEQGGLDISRDVVAAAGHSLGEYSALTAAGAFTVRDAAKLLRIRGNSMQEACPVGESGMVALLGAEFADADALIKAAQKFGSCGIANDNGAGQIVISGVSASIDFVLQEFREFGIKRAVRLPVSAAFHSVLMKSVEDIMANALSSTKMVSPTLPVISNVSVTASFEVDTIRQNLVKQICGCVRWRETMEALEEQYSATEFVELGPGKVLSGIANKMFPHRRSTSISTPKGIEEFLRNRS